jgi:hypothetical protein
MWKHKPNQPFLPQLALGHSVLSYKMNTVSGEHSYTRGRTAFKEKNLLSILMIIFSSHRAWVFHFLIWEQVETTLQIKEITLQTQALCFPILAMFTAALPPCALIEKRSFPVCQCSMMSLSFYLQWSNHFKLIKFPLKCILAMSQLLHSDFLLPGQQACTRKTP